MIFSLNFLQTFLWPCLLYRLFILFLFGHATYFIYLYHSGESINKDF